MKNASANTLRFPKVNIIVLHNVYFIIVPGTDMSRKSG